MPHGVVLYVVPSDGDLEADRRRRRVLPRGARRAVGRRRRARRPAVSLARSRSVPRHGAARRRDVGPRAGAARARHAARPASSSRRPRRCCRASARPSGCSRASIDLKPGQDIAPADLAELLVDAGFTREDPADEHGEFAVRGGILDIFPAGEAQPGPPRVHRRHDRVAAHLRPGDAALGRADRSGRDRPAARRARSDDRRRDASSTTSRAPSDSRIIVSERDEVDAHAIEARRAASSDSYEDARQPQGAACAARRRELLRRTWSSSTRGSPHATQPRAARPRRRRARARRDAGLAPASLPRITSAASRPSRCTAASPTGSPRSAGCATTGETTLFVAATPGRAERTIELLKEYDVFAVPVERADDARYAAVLVAIGGAVARLPAARRRPADLRRGRRLRGRAPRARAPPRRRPRRFSRTCAI